MIFKTKEMEDLLEWAARAIEPALKLPEGAITVHLVNLEEGAWGKSPGLNIVAKCVLGDMNCTVAEGKIVEMPGCCGLVVSTGAWVSYDERNYGVGTIMSDLRSEIAKCMGYTAMICTDVDTNAPQQKVLGTLGWDRVSGFVNRRTDNPLSIHVKYLYESDQASESHRDFVPSRSKEA